MALPSRGSVFDRGGMGVEVVDNHSLKMETLISSAEAVT